MSLFFVTFFAIFLNVSLLEKTVLDTRNGRRTNIEVVNTAAPSTFKTDSFQASFLIQSQFNQLDKNVLLLEYPTGRVTLKNGQTFTGKNVQLYKNRVALYLQAPDRKLVSFLLYEVMSVEGKGRKPRTIASVVGGSTMGLMLAIFATSGGKATNSETGEVATINTAHFMIGSVALSLGTAAFGAFFGWGIDDWTLIYYPQ